MADALLRLLGVVVVLPLSFVVGVGILWGANWCLERYWERFGKSAWPVEVTFHRVQTHPEMRLQQMCVELAVSLKIPPPSVFIGKPLDETNDAWFSPDSYSVLFSAPRFRGHRNPITHHILKHELVHAWCWVNRKPLDHGPAFQKKAKEFGTS